MVHTPHLDHVYERELTTITAAVAQMCQLAEQMIHDAVSALKSGDKALGQKVIADDRQLDAMEMQIDGYCIRLMARRAPVGADLRMVTATLKLVTDVERIGDLAVNIAKRFLSDEHTIALPEEVQELADTALEELALAFQALRERDVTIARSLRERDKVTDARNRAAFDRLIRLGREQSEHFERLLALTNVCRHLERVGDHAVNIAEMVVFMVEGKVLRHHNE